MKLCQNLTLGNRGSLTTDSLNLLSKFRSHSLRNPFLPLGDFFFYWFSGDACRLIGDDHLGWTFAGSLMRALAWGTRPLSRCIHFIYIPCLSTLLTLAPLVTQV
jgi:hypothetical protein